MTNVERVGSSKSHVASLTSRSPRCGRFRVKAVMSASPAIAPCAAFGVNSLLVATTAYRPGALSAPKRCCQLVEDFAGVSRAELSTSSRAI